MKLASKGLSIYDLWLRNCCKARATASLQGYNIPQTPTRHPELKAKYAPPIDKVRVNAKNYATFAAWFDLFTNLRKDFKCKMRISEMWTKKALCMAFAQKPKSCFRSMRRRYM